MYMYLNNSTYPLPITSIYMYMYNVNSKGYCIVEKLASIKFGELALRRYWQNLYIWQSEFIVP